MFPCWLQSSFIFIFSDKILAWHYSELFGASVRETTLIDKCAQQLMDVFMKLVETSAIVIYCHVANQIVSSANTPQTDQPFVSINQCFEQTRRGVHSYSVVGLIPVQVAVCATRRLALGQKRSKYWFNPGNIPTRLQNSWLGRKASYASSLLICVVLSMFMYAWQ